MLDRQRVKGFEDARAESDAHFQIMLSCLVWFPLTQRFEVPLGSTSLDIVVPRSQWVDKVVSSWNLSSIKVVEIRFPKGVVGDNFRAAYMKVEAAERLFANGQWKQTLAELYSGSEVLANAFGFAKPDQQFFATLISHPIKKEKFKLALDYFCDALHLGRHEPKEAAEAFSVFAKDARFALTMAHAVFEYITPDTA